MITRLENALPKAATINPKVSKRGVDWHLEHSLKIINSICDTLVASDPKAFKPKFSIIKTLILWTGKMPRGKAPSPKPFNNKEEIDREQLPIYLKKAKEALVSIENLPAKSHFPHPMFGHLNLKEGKKFIEIHTNHHLAIIDDILKA